MCVGWAPPTSATRCCSETTFAPIPLSAAAYGELKRRLAAVVADVSKYADVKDPACDLIMIAAEDWARGHTPARSRSRQEKPEWS
jgi:hypothetical protein